MGPVNESKQYFVHGVFHLTYNYLNNLKECNFSYTLAILSHLKGKKIVFFVKGIEKTESKKRLLHEVMKV